MAGVAVAKGRTIDGPWGLPEGWEWIPLGSLCESLKNDTINP